MTLGAGQAAASTPGTHLLLYDGVCGLCNGLVTALLQRDRQQRFHFAALQSEAAIDHIARLGYPAPPAETVVLIANYQSDRGVVLTKARAALFAASELGWPWRIAALAGVLPTAVLNFGYDLVARHRYRLFGRSEQCILPRPEYRSRFIDGSGGGPLQKEWS